MLHHTLGLFTMFFNEFPQGVRISLGPNHSAPQTRETLRFEFAPLCQGSGKKTDAVRPKDNIREILVARSGDPAFYNFCSTAIEALSHSDGNR